MVGGGSEGSVLKAFFCGMCEGVNMYEGVLVAEIFGNFCNVRFGCGICPYYDQIGLAPILGTREQQRPQVPSTIHLTQRRIRVVCNHGMLILSYPHLLCTSLKALQVHADSSNFAPGASKREMYTHLHSSAQALFLDQRNWVPDPTPSATIPPLR